MKKIILCLLSILMLFLFCGCSEPKFEKKQIYTEVQDNLKITYIYDERCSVIVTKNIYNMDTGVTIEYVYFYEKNGWGIQHIGVAVITTSKDGQIINQFEDKVQ